MPYESLKYAMDVDIKTFDEEKHISWIVILALAGCRTGGRCGIESVKKAAKDLQGTRSGEELAGELMSYYDYYYKAYSAALGGLLGSYAIKKDGQWHCRYGLKAFSPIAEGYGYRHCSDFGNQRSFGFARKHLGNDLMGRLGTPVGAVEGAWWKQWDGIAMAVGESE